MSKAKNLLDFYPVVKTPAKRIKVFSSEAASTSSKGPTAKQGNLKGWGVESIEKLSQCEQHVEKKAPAVASVQNNSRKRKLSDDAGVADSPKRINPPPLLLEENNKEVQNSDTKMSAIRSSLMNQLTKSGKIGELKETLSKLNAAKAKLEALKSTVSSSSSSATATAAAAEKSESFPKLPAYQRFHALAASDSTSQLTLPYKYKFLADVFHSTDTVAAIAHNRQEVCTFTKLKPAVQEMMHRNFHLKHLGQIKSVYPLAYIFKQEKILCRGGNRLHPTVESQLTVTINTDCFDSDTCHSNVNAVETRANNSSSSPVDPGFLISRRRVFRKHLVQILMEHHSKFLCTLDPPISLSADEIRRWHPSFLVEDVPEVISAELPEVESAMKYMSAIDVLNKIKGLYSKKLDKALENVAIKSASIETEQSSSTSTIATVDSIKPTDSNESLKGIPLQLLAKIRAKKAEKIKAEMTRNPAADKRKVMISRLPEIVRILRNYFIAEKKAAISLGSAVKKIGESFIGSLTPVEMEDHLKLLVELAPEWLNCVTIKGRVFLKLDRRADVNAVIENVVRVEKAIP